MRATLNVRTLVLLAVTNPVVWLLVLLALLAVVCCLLVMMYAALFEYARNELRSTRPSPPDDDWPLLPPTEIVALLDEFGRVELLVEDPETEALAVALQQEGVTPEDNGAPPKPRPAPSAARTTKKLNPAPVEPLSRAEAEQLRHEELVRLAHRRGAKGANRRWGRERLLAVIKSNM